MLPQVWRKQKKHTKMTTREHKGTFCLSTTSNQWKYEYSEIHLISSYHRHLISTKSGGWITKSCSVTDHWNHTNEPQQHFTTSVRASLTPREKKRQDTRTESHVRGEGNHADYAHFSKYRKPLVIGAPRCRSDNLSVHYKQTKLIFMFIADAPSQGDL